MKDYYTKIVVYDSTSFSSNNLRIVVPPILPMERETPLDTVFSINQDKIDEISRLIETEKDRKKLISHLSQMHTINRNTNKDSVSIIESNVSMNDQFKGNLLTDINIKDDYSPDVNSVTVNTINLPEKLPSWFQFDSISNSQETFIPHDFQSISWKNKNYIHQEKISRGRNIDLLRSDYDPFPLEVGLYIFLISIF